MTDPGAPSTPEQTFFADPALDRVLRFAFALGAEVHVLRDRLARLEDLLQREGVVTAEALASHQRDPEAAAADRAAFARALMEAFRGQAAARHDLAAAEEDAGP